MPLFSRKRQSELGRKKMEHKMYIAGESREPVYDLSDCELTEVPSNLFAQCRIMQKESLLLHSNWLDSLTSTGAKLRDLHLLRVLDLHGNLLQRLPDEIGLLVSLQVLDVSHNKMKQLPSTLPQLVHLTTLNAEFNQLKDLPDNIGSVCHMRQLFLNDNPLHSLPKSLVSLVGTLEELRITPSPTLQYPPPDVASLDTESILQFLCVDCGIPYTRNTELRTSPMNGGGITDGKCHQYSSSSSSSASFLTDPQHHPPITACGGSPAHNSILQYEQMKEEKRQKFLALERQMQEETALTAELALRANHYKNSHLDRMMEEESKTMQQLNELHNHRDSVHRQLLSDLRGQEEEAEELVQHLLAVNVTARRRERLMERMEEERAHAEKWFVVRQEESTSLRRQEVLNAMHSILSETELACQLRDRLLKNRELTLQNAQQSLLAEESAIQAVLSTKAINQSLLIDQLMYEETLQKQAFAQLQMQKDSCMQRIHSEMELIENELRKLSLVEMEKRLRKQEVETRILAEKRAELILLYRQLQEERERRDAQLRERMMEMETAREQDQIDFWLIQYQRLLDRKPQALYDQERQLEKAVYSILQNANALDYLAQFQRHRITIETLAQMSENDLQQIGVHQFGVRKDILKEVVAYLKLEEKTRALEGPFDTNDGASAPPLSFSQSTSELTKGDKTLVTEECFTAPGLEVADMQAHVEVTCCICLDKESSVLFLGCGHICCCSWCSPTVRECPLCRATILQRVVLNATLTLKEEQQ